MWVVYDMYAQGICLCVRACIYDNGKNSKKIDTNRKISGFTLKSLEPFGKLYTDYNTETLPKGYIPHALVTAALVDADSNTTRAWPSLPPSLPLFFALSLSLSLSLSFSLSLSLSPPPSLPLTGLTKLQVVSMGFNFLTTLPANLFRDASVTAPTLACARGTARLRQNLCLSASRC